MQNPGRGPMMKTGRNIPKEFMGPGMYKDGGPQIGQGPGDGIKKALDKVTGTTHRGGFLSGNQMAATQNRNTDLLEVGKKAFNSAVEKVKSFFD